MSKYADLAKRIEKCDGVPEIYMALFDSLSSDEMMRLIGGMEFGNDDGVLVGDDKNHAYILDEQNIWINKSKTAFIIPLPTASVNDAILFEEFRKS